MEIKATLEEKVSKNGNNYTVVVIHLTDTCKKNVFLEPAEIELLKMHNNKEEASSDSFWK